MQTRHLAILGVAVIVPSTPGNGTVITDLHLYGHHLGGGKSHFRVLQNTTEAVYTSENEVHGKYQFENGLSIAKGASLSIQLFSTNKYAGTTVVRCNVLGYKW